MVGSHATPTPVSERCAANEGRTLRVEETTWADPWVRGRRHRPVRSNCDAVVLYEVGRRTWRSGV